MIERECLEKKEEKLHAHPFRQYFSIFHLHHHHHHLILMIIYIERERESESYKNILIFFLILPNMTHSHTRINKLRERKYSSSSSSFFVADINFKNYKHIQTFLLGCLNVFIHFLLSLYIYILSELETNNKSQSKKKKINWR